MNTKKLKLNWKGFLIALGFTLLISMNFYLYDQVMENRTIIENIIDNS